MFRRRNKFSQEEMKVEQELTESDNNSVTSPSYYGDYVVKPIDFIVNNNIPFAEGNIIKYVVRWKQKNGVEDLKKAKVYLDKLIELGEQNLDKEGNSDDPSS
jgi:hypothetical protein|tara:strand:- start:1959 stop:2264 length:306 start_codon:yes stop_codon:yes gene_type:complete